MAQTRKSIAKTAAAPTALQGMRADWRGLIARLSYTGMVNNVPFMAYLALLVMLYITNSNRAVQTQYELNKQAAVLKELRWRHMDAQTRLMNAGTEQDIMRRTAPLGLAPLALPAYSISSNSSMLVSSH